jgi:hypothetical protein
MKLIMMGHVLERAYALWHGSPDGYIFVSSRHLRHDSLAFTNFLYILSTFFCVTWGL